MAVKEFLTLSIRRGNTYLRMSEEEKNAHAVAMGQLGGPARAKALTPAERKAIARNAAAARWAGHVAKRPASSRKKAKK